MMRLAACVMPWRLRQPQIGASAGIECFLLRRNVQTPLMPGYWSFVGSSFDADDLIGDLQHEMADGQAVYRAAVRCVWRMLFDAAGLLPRADAHSLPSPQQKQAQAQAREALQTRSASFVDVLATLGLKETCLRQPTAAGVYYTPFYGQTRFATQTFFLQLQPHEQLQLGTQQGTWVTPQDALQAWASCGWPLAPHVVQVLQQLAQSPTASDAAVSQVALRRCAAADAPEQSTAQTLMPRIEVLPVRSPTLPPATHTNCYLLGGSDIAVVDPGTPYPDEQPLLMQHLAARVAAGGRIREIWLTHHHADHIGAAHAVQARFGGRIRAHALTAQALQGQVRVDDTIADNQELPLGGTDLWRALFTPGHAVGHLCFYDTARHHVLSGDNVLGSGTSIVLPAPDGDMRAYMGSLGRLLTLPLGLLLPGHGPPAAQSIDRIQNTLQQRQQRERMLLQIVAQNASPMPFASVVKKLYRGLAPKLQKLAALSAQAHVDKLVADAQLVALDDAELGPMLSLAPTAVSQASNEGDAMMRATDCKK